MARTALNPLHDLRTLIAYLRLFRRERPDIVLAYTQKPIIYAGLALRMIRGPRYSAMVTGFGYVFSEADRHRWLQFVTTRLFRAALSRADRVLAFNRDDARELIERGMLSGRDRLKIVPGSGVDLARFRFRPVGEEPPIFLLVARMLTDKGIVEFTKAARMVRAAFPSARFQLLGPFDTNPAAISRDVIAEWVRSGAVEYLGSTDDVRPYLAACTVFVLPSYREGLPRTVLEAMAIGRAIITTDAPGCRETVEHGTNGLLVAPRDAAALADAMLRFCCDPGLARRMGGASRSLAEAKYDVEKVNELVLDLILPPAGKPAARLLPANEPHGAAAG